jgi:hypothetical protein
MNCQNQSKNRLSCSCSYEPCPRKGICCECLRYHLAMTQLPACAFSTKGEVTYDRSIANFIRDYKGR